MNSKEFFIEYAKQYDIQTKTLYDTGGVYCSMNCRNCSLKNVCSQLFFSTPRITIKEIEELQEEYPEYFI